MGVIRPAALHADAAQIGGSAFGAREVTGCES